MKTHHYIRGNTGKIIAQCHGGAPPGAPTGALIRYCTDGITVHNGTTYTTRTPMREVAGLPLLAQGADKVYRTVAQPKGATV